MADSVGNAPTSPCGDSVFKTDAASLYLPTIQNFSFFYLFQKLFVVFYKRLPAGNALFFSEEKANVSFIIQIIKLKSRNHKIGGS